jgi:hypothetical protein
MVKIDIKMMSKIDAKSWRYNYVIFLIYCDPIYQTKRFLTMGFNFSRPNFAVEPFF